MQGQMHVHVAELGLPVPLLGHFFRQLRADLGSGPCVFLKSSWQLPVNRGLFFPFL
jgi:hypothetical protein